jgi:FkbM family methyltransferase
MVNEVLLDKSFVQRIGAFPAVGYPLIFGWRRGWVPVPKGVAKVRFKDGRMLRCDLSDSTQRTMALGLFEPAESRLVKELLNPQDAFVDVGAHIGWFTTIAAQCVGKEGQVIACEPYPPNVAALKENLALNGAANVRLVDMALGSRPGTLSLGFDADSGATTALDWGGPAQRVEAPMTTLDEVTADVAAVTLLKMDVEGWEAHVLRGGSEVLARTEHVLIEINKPVLKKAGSSPEELYALLRSSGFKTFIPVAQHGLRRLLPDDDLVNVLATR